MEQFKILIINTFERWYDLDYKRTRDTIQDYIDVVIESDVENQLGRFLEKKPTNLLTLDTLPVLDLGDKPASYDPKASEAA